MKVSVVIPAYNAEKKIKKAVYSLQKQTYKNLEIVCVNDGSTDHTRTILETMQLKDNRIRIINQENKGAFQARKAGILGATGEYIMFLDCDDTLLSKDCIAELVTLLESHKDVQIIQFGYKNCKGCISTNRLPKREGVVQADEIKKIYYRDFIGTGDFECIGVQLWSKIYDAAIVKRAVRGIDISLRMGEDLYLNLAILDERDFSNMLIIHKSYYKYNCGIGFSSKMPKDILNEYSVLKNYQIELCDKWQLAEEARRACHIETLYYNLNIVKGMWRNKWNDQDIEDYLLRANNYECVKRAKNYFATNRDNMWEELQVLVYATPKEYLDWVKNHTEKPEGFIRKGIRKILKH